MSDSAQDDAARVTVEAPPDTAAAGEADALEAPASGEKAEASTESQTGEKPDLDEMKRKFREALDRKRQANSADAVAAGGRGTGKVHGAHGPASTRRSFRRKSG